MANAPPALTTTFTPPSSCLSQTFLESYRASQTDTQRANVLGDVRSTASCLPDALNPARTSFFSPGLHCPVGYTVACSSTNVLGGTATETFATCCPTGGFSCKATAGFFWVFDSSFGCRYDFPTSTTGRYTSSSAGRYYTTQHVLRGGYDYLNAFSVQLRWQSSDLTPSTTSSNGPTGGASASSSVSATAAASDSSGLSTGAKAGIGVGAGIGGLIVLALLLFGLTKWRKKRAAAAELPSGGHPSNVYGPPMNSYQSYDQPKYGQAQPTGAPQPAELDSRNRVHEVPG